MQQNMGFRQLAYHRSLRGQAFSRRAPLWCFLDTATLIIGNSPIPRPSDNPTDKLRAGEYQCLHARGLRKHLPLSTEGRCSDGAFIACVSSFHGDQAQSLRALGFRYLIQFRSAGELCDDLP